MNSNSEKCISLLNDLSVGLKVDLSKVIPELINDPVLLNSKFEETLLPIAEACNYKSTLHPDWGILAGRVEVRRIRLTTPSLKDLVTNYSELFGENYKKFCEENHEILESFLVDSRDDDFTFFGIRTLEKSYFVRNGKITLETPQRMYLRVATFLWMESEINIQTNKNKFSNKMKSLNTIQDYYELMSRGLFTHASPTLFNAGLKNGSLSSCFLLSMQDSLDKIFKCLGQCAMISKAMGGIGLDVSNIRHSAIGTSGSSSGIIPMLQVYDKAMRYVDQGGRRKGSATIFLQPWHIDILDFIEAKRPQGVEERRARDLFYSIWSCDLFMKRVKNDEIWSLFCPKKASGLTECYGDEFDELYIKYEKEKKYERQLPARDVWNEILKTQIETGMPFITHKDTANFSSNQQNLGLIRSSNLCVEIIEVTDETTISSCNLASIALDEFVEFGGENPIFNFNLLGETVRKVVRSLNRVIDLTCYPLSKGDVGPIESTNLKFRPLGLGVQGLADTFFKLNISWTGESRSDSNHFASQNSPEAKELNSRIFATIYWYALDESAELAKEFGSYQGFESSPASKGLLKFDLLKNEYRRKNGKESPFTECGHLDWESLRNKVKQGLRNSLLIALMPTASTAQIRNKTESFEPVTSNIYSRSVLSGNHIVVNKYMVEALESFGLWNQSIVNQIIKDDGSVQGIPNELIKPENQEKFKNFKEMFKTAFEIKQKVLVDLSIDRAYYVCQSQSLNIFIKDPTFQQLTGLHFYAWENCLSTGMYYLRTAPSTEPIKFTVEGEIDVKKKVVVCNEEVCVVCQA